MSFLSNTILAFSMSADAFAASIGKGVVLKKPGLAAALRVGLIFGCVEAITPVLGWLLGLVASRFIASIDHWIAFVILSIIGAKMIYEGFTAKPGEETQPPSFGMLVATAFGTSIDAMAVGVTLALINANIWVISAMIGGATFVMSTIGIMFGNWLGSKAGKMAEIIGGLCLIAIGSTILCEHLWVAN